MRASGRRWGSTGAPGPAANRRRLTPSTRLVLPGVALLLLLAAACGDDDSASPQAAATYDFPTGPAVLIEEDYTPPTDRVDSTGAYLPVNGKPTLVFLEAIWCPFCALTRPAVHALRFDYQDRVNFVILDVDQDDERALAIEMGAQGQPFFAVIPAGAGPDAASHAIHGPLTEDGLRDLLDRAIAESATDPGRQALRQAPQARQPPRSGPAGHGPGPPPVLPDALRR